MSRTIPTNISSGLGAGEHPVLLIDVHCASTTHYRWSTLATADFDSWAGNAYAGKIVKSSPMRIMADIIKGAGCGQLGSFTFSVQNPGYSGSTSLYDYMIDQTDYPHGAVVTVYLITTHGTAQDEEDGLIVFTGKVQKVSQTLAEMKFVCKDDLAEHHLDLPQTQINEDNYPNAFDHPAKNIKGNVFVPISFGEAGEGYFLALMTDSRNASDRELRIDTETCGGGGDIYVLDVLGPRDTGYNWGADEKANTVTAWGYTKDQTLVKICIDVYVDGSDWTDNFGSDEEETIDGNLATHAAHYVRDYGGYPDAGEIFWYEFAEDATMFELVSAVMHLKLETSRAIDYDYEWCRVKNQGITLADQLIDDGGFSLSEAVDVPLLWDGKPWPLEYLGVDKSVPYGNSFYLQVGTIHTGSGITFKCYELKDIQFTIRYAFAEVSFLMDGDGREFGSTWNGRKTAANTITSLAEAVEAVVRHELSVGDTGIDDATFDAANTALNSWTGKAYNDSTFRVFGQQQKKLNSKNLIKQLCKESGLTHGIDYDGTHALHMITNEGTADYTIEEADIKKGSFKTWSSGSNEIYNDFIINFDKCQATGRYQKSIVMNKAAGYSGGDAYKYLQDRCFASYSRYGFVRQKIVNCDWIASEGTAWKLMDWLCYYYCFIRTFCSFDATLLGLLKAEVMDVASVKHKLTDMTSGVNFIIYECQLAVSKNKLTTTHKGMFIESMGDRDDGDPE